MSPGATTIRTYTELKARILRGDFAPGMRLDPGRLAKTLDVSPTPVRDALHRLVGERLLEDVRYEGFRQPIVTEPMVRDYYDWSNAVMQIVAQAASRRENPDLSGFDPIDQDYASRVAGCFAGIAALSGNEEHRAAVASLNDRGALYRIAEHRFLVRAEEDIAAIAIAQERRDWPETLRSIEDFHRRRLSVVIEVSAFLRPRSAT